MPLARGYDSQIMPQDAARPVTASPEAFGAGIGQALERAGDGLHRSQLRSFQVEKQVTADQENADFAHKFALHRQNMDGIVAETRANAAPGAAGHVEQVMEANEAARETMLEGLTDPAVQRRAQQQWDEYSTRLHDGATTFSAVAGANKLVQDVKGLTDVGANRVRQGVDPQAYIEEVKQAYAAIDAMRGISADQKAQLRREQVDQKYGIAFLNHMVDTNPRGALDQLDQGAFNDVLEPAQIDQLRNAAGVEIRRGEAAAQHAVNLQKAEIGQKVGVLEEADRQGIALPQADYDAAITQLTAIGDADRALKIEGLRDNARFAQIYEGQSPVQRQQRLAELQAKKNPSAPEQREIKWLTDKSGALDSRFESDPTGFAIANAPAGMRPPAGDVINDPAVMAGRASWAARASVAYGRPVPPLTKSEADQLKANKARGEDQVLRTLDAIGDPVQRLAAARQIDGADTAFQHMALINPHTRPTIRAGADKLKSDPKFLTVNAKEDPGRDEAFKAWEVKTRVALKEMGIPDQDATLAIAKQFLAGTLSHSGGDVNAVTGNMLDLGLRVALGGSIKNGKPIGGLGNWGGRPFVLPETDGNPDFGARVTRWLQGRAKNPPVNPDGSPIAIRDLTPVLIGPGRYRWEAGGRVAVGKDGKPLIMELGR